jgi:hypothetical protein
LLVVVDSPANHTPEPIGTAQVFSLIIKGFITFLAVSPRTLTVPVVQLFSLGSKGPTHSQPSITSSGQPVRGGALNLFGGTQ